MTSRRSRRASSRQAGGLDGVLRAGRRYFPVTRNTRVERAILGLLAVVAVLVAAFLAWVLMR